MIIKTQKLPGDYVRVVFKYREEEFELTFQHSEKDYPEAALDAIEYMVDYIRGAQLERMR